MSLNTVITLIILFLFTQCMFLRQTEFDYHKLQGDWYYLAGTREQVLHNGKLNLKLDIAEVNYTISMTGKNEHGKWVYFLAMIMHEDDMQHNEWYFSPYFNNQPQPKRAPFYIEEADTDRYMIQRMVIDKEGNEWWFILSRTQTVNDTLFAYYLDRANKLSGIDSDKFINYT